MDEQLSIIISILAALLTGGFLMIFIESQKVAGGVTDRFHFIMKPFYRDFSNYVKFISSFKTWFTFNVSDDSDYINRLKDNVEMIGRLGGISIVSGQDFPADYFSAKELETICNTINNIWYLIDQDINYFDNHIDFHSRHEQRSSEYTKKYLEALSPKYKGMELTKNMLASVSGDFFVERYQPIEHILFEYENWQNKEKGFKILTIITVVFTLFTMILILFLSSNIPIWIYKVLCLISCGLLIFELFQLLKIEKLSKTIMR